MRAASVARWRIAASRRPDEPARPGALRLDVRHLGRPVPPDPRGGSRPEPRDARPVPDAARRGAPASAGGRAERAAAARTLLATAARVRRDRDRDSVGPPRRGRAGDLELADRVDRRRGAARRGGDRGDDRGPRAAGRHTSRRACSSASAAVAAIVGVNLDGASATADRGGRARRRLLRGRSRDTPALPLRASRARRDRRIARG